MDSISVETKESGEDFETKESGDDFETKESGEESGEESEEESGEESDAEIPAELTARFADLAASVAHMTENKAKLEAMIADLNLQLTAIRTANPEFSPALSEKAFDARKDAYQTADHAHLNALKKLNTEIMEIRKRIDAKKAEIAKKCVIRGKEPPTDYSNYQIISDMEAEIERVKRRIRVPIPPSLTDIEFFKKYPYYWDYLETRKKSFVILTSPILTMSKKLSAELAELESVLHEDTWRPKYLTYAWRNGLECDDENIFRKCNDHYMCTLLDDYWFNCPCQADEDEYGCGSDEEKYGHAFCDGANNRCTRGTKMIVEWDLDDLPIGFIDESSPEYFARVMLK